MPSFLSEPSLLIRAGPARARIESGRARLRPGPNSGIRAGLAGLVLIGHLYPFMVNAASHLWWVNPGPRCDPLEWLPSDTPDFPFMPRQARSRARCRRVREREICLWAISIIFW
jgi:hypothetical protein